MFRPNPKDATFDDDTYLLHVLTRQLAHFGPISESYVILILMEDVET
jgi:hypothetical protein